MKSKFDFQHLPLRQIVAHDWTLATTPRWMKHPKLEQSIRKHGILTPIHLVSASDEKFRIISGFRRFQVALALELDEVPVLVRPVQPDLFLFLEQLEANLACRVLEVPEQATVISKLYRDFEQPAKKIIEEILPLLGLKADRYHFNRWLCLADLKESLQKAILAGLDLEVALELGALPEDDSEFFLGLCLDWELGKPRQRQLIQLFAELSRIRAEKFSTLWASARLPEKQRACSFDEAKQALFRLRYPRLDAHKESFRRLQRTLCLPKQIRIEPPPFFEGNELSVTIRVRSPEELGRLSDRLCRLAARDELKEMFALL